MASEGLRDAALQKPFYVPVLAHRWAESKELNAALAAAVLAEAERSPGTVKSNVGGWQSEQDFLRWTGDAGRQIGERILAAANHATAQLLKEHGATGARFSWKVAIWANLNRRGDWNKMHYHPGATWSGVYYVDPGDPPPAETPKAGAIAFMDPILPAQMSFFAGLVPQYLEFQPEVGLMLLFPAYLPHIVQPYLGERPRISIAFNVHKEPYP